MRNLGKIGKGTFSRPRSIFKVSPATILGVISVAMGLFVACTSGGGGSTAQKAADLAPEIEMTLFSGEAFKLSDLRGRPLVVNFWFPSCPPCRAEMPDLEEAWQNHKDDGLLFVGVQLLGVDTVEDGKEFIADMGITYPIGYDEDGRIIIDYEVSGFPSTFFITKEGEVARKWTGALDIERLEEFIQQIL